MPQAKSSYDKIIAQCSKNNWVDYPPFHKLFNYDELFKIINYSVHRIELGKTHKPKTWDDYLNLILKYNSFKKGIFLEKMIFVYGEVNGTLKFDEYRRKQAITNTYEYKKIKYGMSLDEFNEYNKSRAVTLDNLAQKYGVIEGNSRYNEYCKRQAFTNTIEYLGEERYKKVNKLKSHNLDNYTQKYGEEIGRKKLLEFFQRSSCGNSYSKISQKCFNEVELFLTESERKYTYYATKNKEYALLHDQKCFLYDFVCTHLKFCIEYHGDHFHGNPLIYKPDSHLRGRGCTNTKAKDKWKQDELKAKWLEEQRGYVTIVVWDSEWRRDSDQVLEKIKKFISIRRELTI